MAVYDWRDFERIASNGTLQTLARRYDSAVGAQRVEAWQHFVSELLELLSQAETPQGRVRIDIAVDRFRESTRSTPPPPKKTVFVSHQRNDKHWAESVAWEVAALGLDYWLDVHDLGFLSTPSPSPPPAIHAALIAVIIEMALLNCTHIVSLQTTHARGSRWVPYEIGRAKERMTIATNGASWFHAPLWLDPGGDYLALTFCARQDVDLYAWLEGVAGSKLRNYANTIWRGQPGPPKYPLPN